MSTPGIAVPGTSVPSGALASPGGAQGIGGINATTLTNAPFTVPAVGASATATVNDASWISPGQMVYVDQAGGGVGLAGALQVTSKVGNTLTLLNPAPPGPLPTARITTVSIPFTVPAAGASVNATLTDTSQIFAGDALYFDNAGNGSHSFYVLSVSGNVATLRYDIQLSADSIVGTSIAAATNIYKIGPIQSLLPAIWYVRQRSFNSLHNSNFEVEQRYGDGQSAVTTNGALPADRWNISLSGTMTSSFQQNAVSPPIVVPGTNYAITRKFLRVTLTGQEASLGVNDFLSFQQSIEGPQTRELISDATSASILVRSSVSGLKFGLSICDPSGSRSLCKLCTLAGAGTLTLFTFPNLPVFPSTGTFSLGWGQTGYIFRIALATGANYTAPANDTWQNGNFIGAAGQSNFAASPVNSTFDIAFAQHEPGPYCSSLIDLDWVTNYRQCLRYFAKSYPYTTLRGTATDNGSISTAVPASSSWIPSGVRFPQSMAKAPTVTIYGRDGTINAVGFVQGNGAAKAIGSVSGTSESGFSYIGMTTANNTTNDWCIYHYLADTAW